MLVFQHLEGLTEVFGRMSAGMSGPKPPCLGFSFVPEIGFLWLLLSKNLLQMGLSSLMGCQGKGDRSTALPLIAHMPYFVN